MRMTTMIILLSIEMLMIIINLKIFKNDILSPSTISSITFFVATLFALYCADVWEITISTRTNVVITAGLITMTIGEYIGRKVRLSVKRKSAYSTNTDMGIPTIFVKQDMKNLFMVSVIACMGLYTINAYRVGLINGGTGLNAFAYMKNAYMTSVGSTMNPIIRQGYKVVMSAAYISCFIFTNNCLVRHDGLKKNWQYIVMIACGFIITIVAGARTEILRIVSALLLDYTLLWRLNAGGNSRVNKQSSKVVIRKAVPLILLVTVIAYISRAIVKTSNVATTSIDSIVYYMAYYIGSPIAVLNTKLEMAFDNGGLLLGAKNIVPQFVYLGHLDYGGNVGTILQTSVLKYGLLYMIIWILLIYIVSGFIYRKVTSYKEINMHTSLLIILFSNWYYVFSMAYYSDVMSDIGFIITNISTCIVGYLIYHMLFKLKLR
jgi:oligosaccharide repeat unit polymerase